MRDRLLRKRLLSRVVVTLKSGDSFEGVLYELDSRAWFLRDASAMRERRTPTCPWTGRLCC